MPEQAYGPKPKWTPPRFLPVDARARTKERRSRVEYLVIPAETTRRLLERSRDIPLSYGPRKIRELYAIASQHVIGSTMQIALWSLGGANFVAFTYVEPLLSHAHALQVVSAFDRFVARAGRGIFPSSRCISSSRASRRRRPLGKETGPHFAFSPP